jgi:hypothetical protein
VQPEQPQQDKETPVRLLQALQFLMLQQVAEVVLVLPQLISMVVLDYNPVSQAPPYTEVEVVLVATNTLAAQAQAA